MWFAVGLLVILLLNPEHVSAGVRGRFLQRGSSGDGKKGGGKSQKGSGKSKTQGGGSPSAGSNGSSEDDKRFRIAPVTFKEITDPFDSLILDDTIAAMRHHLNHMNEILLISKDIDDAEREEAKCMRDAEKAEQEEAKAETQAEREARKQEKVAAHLEKQAAFERAMHARDKEEALEATRVSGFKAAMAAVEKYNEEVQSNASKSAQSLEEQTKKDTETETGTDKSVWRAKKEAARDAAKKSKELFQNGRIALKEACKSLEKAEEILVAARMESLQRSEMRLGNIVLSQSSADADEAYAVVKQQVTDLTKKSQVEAADLKAKCKMVLESQQFYNDRVLSAQENILSLELAKLEILDADDKYKKALEIKKASDQEVADTCHEEAGAESDSDKKAAKAKLKILRETASESEVILAAASQKLRKAQNKEVEMLNYMIKEASEERESEKADIETPDQIQAVLSLDRVQLIKADDKIETQRKAAEDIKAYQDDAILTLNKKLEGEEAVLVACEEDIAVLEKQLEALAPDGTLSPEQTDNGTGTGETVQDISNATNQPQREALQALLDEREADLLATKQAREETQGQIRRLKTDEEIITQALLTIPQAEKFYQNLVKISEMRETAAIAQEDIRFIR